MRYHGPCSRVSLEILRCHLPTHLSEALLGFSRKAHSIRLLQSGRTGEGVARLDLPRTATRTPGCYRRTRCLGDRSREIAGLCDEVSEAGAAADHGIAGRVCSGAGGIIDVAE